MLNSYPVYAVLPASDLGRAREWWRDRVGLTPAAEDLGGLWYECADGTWVVVTPSPYAGTAQNTAVAFRVDDVTAVMASLRATGVVFEDYDLPDFKTEDGLFEQGGYRAAWFKDSEGNIVEIHSVPAD